MPQAKSAPPQVSHPLSQSVLSISPITSDPATKLCLWSPVIRTLKELGLSPTGNLIRNGDHVARGAESTAQNNGQGMTSPEMYYHLNASQEMYPQPVRHMFLLNYCVLPTIGYLSRV